MMRDVRLSPWRIVLRAGLLLVGAAFMAWRAMHTRSLAQMPGMDAGNAVTLGRIAWVEWILCSLALLTAVVALASLRRRPPRQRLTLPGTGGPPRREEP
jgi:uncharacterized membrane protein YcjF (UPF0283 family)